MKAIIVTQNAPDLLTIMNFLTQIGVDDREIITIMDTGRSLYSWWDWFIDANKSFLYIDPKINISSFSDLFTPTDLRLLINRTPPNRTIIIAIASPESFDMHWMYKPIELSISGSMNWEEDYIVSKSMDQCSTQAEVIVITGRLDLPSLFHKLSRVCYRKMVEEHGLYVSFGCALLMDSTID